MIKNTDISIFSKALYSSWCYHETYKTLFDVGEGCATFLGNELPNVERIFIGHSHGDHVLGLPSVLGCRNNAQGTSRNTATLDHNKPLTIYYPIGAEISDLYDFCHSRYGNWLRYKLDFVPISSGFRLEIGKNLFVDAFSMKHQNIRDTLGFCINETRTRLKKQYAGQNIPELLKSGSVNREDISETYRFNIFAYCLDAYDIPSANTDLLDCQKVVMDCTFIDEKDRTDMTHFTTKEAASLCKENRVKQMFAAHTSNRYKKMDYVEVLYDYGYEDGFIDSDKVAKI